MPHRDSGVQPRWAFLSRSDIPDIEHPERTYLARLRVVETPWGGILLHALRRPDNTRALHDHPWTFWSIIVSGGYQEIFAPNLAAAVARGTSIEEPGPSDNEVQRIWKWLSIHRIHRGEFHAITELAATPTWTVLLVGPRRSDWGFATPAGFVRHEIYETTTALHTPATEN